MNKIKKIVFLAGFTSVGFYSLFSYKQQKYENDVINHSYIEKDHDGQIVAHRGFSSVEVENSLASVDRAFKSDCTDEVEIDVRLTKDEEVVLSHNSSQYGIGKISKKNLSDLETKEYSNDVLSKYSTLKESLLALDGKLTYDRYCDVKNHKEHFVSLNTILDAECDETKTLLIDIKFNSQNQEVFMDKLNSILENYIDSMNIVLQSLDINDLLIMKDKYPNYDYQLILNSSDDFKYLDEDINRFAFKQNIVYKQIIQDQLDKGKIVSVWTINSYNEYIALKDKIGNLIDNVSIITDYPDEMCYLRNDYKIKSLKKESN